MHPGQQPQHHSSAVRVNPPDQGGEAATFQKLTQPLPTEPVRLPGGAVRMNPPDIGIDANLLQKLTTHHVSVEMAKVDPEIRARHVAVLKTLRELNAMVPDIEKFWVKTVGDYQMREAMGILQREADAAIAQETHEKQLAAATKRGR